MKQPHFVWNPELGEALCIIQDKDNTYYGFATCHPDDQDMLSEKTGCEIAFKRASLKLLKTRREELKAELKGLQKFYNSIRYSKKLNPKKYEIKKLIKQIDTLQEDVKTIKEIIEDNRQDLIKYIEGKEDFYQKIRHLRENDKQLDENK